MLPADPAISVQVWTYELADGWYAHVVVDIEDGIKGKPHGPYESQTAALLDLTLQYNLKAPESVTTEYPPLPCPDCGLPMELRKGKYGLFYGCSGFPHCDVTHAAHPDGRPLGVPADRETRKARCSAHVIFDRHWKLAYGKLDRTEAYRWLAGQLGIQAEDCHIGNFNYDTCQRVVAVCQGISTGDIVRWLQSEGGTNGNT